MDSIAHTGVLGEFHFSGVCQRLLAASSLDEALDWVSEGFVIEAGNKIAHAQRFGI